MNERSANIYIARVYLAKVRRRRRQAFGIEHKDGVLVQVLLGKFF